LQNVKVDAFSFILNFSGFDIRKFQAIWLHNHAFIIMKCVIGCQNSNFSIVFKKKIKKKFEFNFFISSGIFLNLWKI
jgi:hypothetical protein